MIVGDRSRFAVEIELHPDSPKSISTGFGLYRFWIADQPYGRSAPDASCLAASCDALRERLGQRGHHDATGMPTGNPLGILERAYWLIYRVTDVHIASRQASAQEVAQARRLMMAPDGDEAFDDGSFVVQWDDRGVVGLAAGLVGEGDGPMIVDPVRSIRLGTVDFYDVVAGAVNFFDTLEP